jgi:hypothetical protein
VNGIFFWRKFDLIGENLFLLAKIFFYWRKQKFIGDFHKFIGELEKMPVFYQ